MTYADELRAEIALQVEHRNLPPLFLKMIDAYADARVNEARHRETCSCWNCNAAYDIRLPKCACGAINANVDTAGAYKQMERGVKESANA